jgi:hypothetical protein
MNGTNTRVLGPEDDRGNDHRDGASDFNPHFYLTVLATSLEGTIAALRAARDLTANLEARITLLTVEEVPFRLPLECPLVPLEFREQWATFLLTKAGVVEEATIVRICLCRNRSIALRDCLPPHSVVVLGGNRNWWSFRERKLVGQLHRLGHRAIFVEAESRHETNLFPRGGFLPVAKVRVAEDSR